jgi:hypothetical protein
VKLDCSTLGGVWEDYINIDLVSTTHTCTENVL